jgi:hypothetical protein
MCIHFLPRGEPFPFFNDRAFQNSNGKEKLSDYEILTFMFSVIKLEISQKLLSISRSTADNFKNISFGTTERGVN